MYDHVYTTVCYNATDRYIVQQQFMAGLFS